MVGTTHQHPAVPGKLSNLGSKVSRFCSGRSGRKAQGVQIVRCLKFHTPVIASRCLGGAQSQGQEEKAVSPGEARV